jgi:hypothetical protein
MAVRLALTLASSMVVDDRGCSNSGVTITTNEKIQKPTTLKLTVHTSPEIVRKQEFGAYKNIFHYSFSPAMYFAFYF